MNQTTALQVLREVERRRSVVTRLSDAAFAEQRAFISDPSRLKAALCTRRAGKSYSVGLYLLHEALTNPGCTCVYVALTRDSAKKIMLKDVLHTIARRFGIAVRTNEVELSVKLPNGSVIYLTGADANEGERAKLLGQKYRLAVVDEAASFKQDLEDLVYKVLRPATADMMGTICLVGTPSDYASGLFYNVTTGAERGWAVHHWSALDNPHMRTQWEEDIREIERDRPAFRETSAYRQMYLGEWCINEDNLVYRYLESRNRLQSAPECVQSCVLGVDLGFEDATAFVVVGWRPHERVLHVLHAAKARALTISGVAEVIRTLQGQYPVHKTVVDGAAKQSVEEMRQRHGLQLVAAEKTDKFGFIQLMNSDLQQGLIKLCGEAADPLAEEWGKLVWDKPAKATNAPPVEASRCENHLSDAALYAWRFSRSFREENASPSSPSRDSEAWMEQEIQRQFEKSQNVQWWEQ